MINLSSCLSYMFGLHLLAGFLDFDMSAGLFQLGFVLEILKSACTFDMALWALHNEYFCHESVIYMGF